MGLFNRFKKIKEENNSISEVSNMEEELDKLYYKLVNKIVSIIPTEWTSFII